MKIRNYVAMTLLSITMFACKKEVTITPPLEVSTNHITEVEWTTATSGGQVPNDGGTTVSFRGVVWGKEPNPTLDLNTKTEDGRGTGEFVSKLTNLEAGTKYFVRAYAINSKDTVYGDQISFTTSSWTPKRMDNLFDWWNSQSGIIKEGDLVEYWIGLNGNKMDHGSDKDRALIVSSDKNWGGNPSVLMNPKFKYKDCGYYVKSSSNKSSKTVFMVAKVYDIHKTNNIMINFGNAVFGMWGYSNGSYFVHHYGYPHFNKGDKFASNTYQFLRFSYDRTKGGTDYFVDNKPSFRSKIHTFNSKPDLNYTSRKIGVGHYDSNYGQTPKMSVVEVLVLDGIPSEDEVITYEKYLKYKYKL
jgi:hypothetical protein